jgi:hypothetical protein
MYLKKWYFSANATRGSETNVIVNFVADKQKAEEISGSCGSDTAHACHKSNCMLQRDIFEIRSGPHVILLKKREGACFYQN